MEHGKLQIEYLGIVLRFATISRLRNKRNYHMTTERLYYLDGLRVFTMLMVVACHVSLSFFPIPLPFWAITDDSAHPYATLIFSSVNSVSMPLFFVISGIFAQRLFQTKGPRAFFINRLHRIGLPLLATWLLLVIIMQCVYFMIVLGQVMTCYYGPDATRVGSLWNFWQDVGFAAKEDWNWKNLQLSLGWLWFIYYLLLFYSLLGLSLALRRFNLIATGLDKGWQWLTHAFLSPKRIFWLGLTSTVLVSFSSGFFERGYWFIRVPSNFTPNISMLLFFGLPFIMGWFLATHQQVIDEWQRYRWQYTCGGVLALLLCLTLEFHYQLVFEAPQYYYLKIVSYALKMLACWMLIFGLFGLFKTYLNKANTLIKSLTEVSYWVYLTHIPVVLALQVGLLASPWPMAVKFVVIYSLALVVVIACYRYFVKDTFIGKILNGRREPLQPAG